MTRSLLILTTAVVTTFLAGGPGLAMSAPTSFLAVALVDSVKGSSDVLEARSDTRGVAGATFTWTAGVTGRVPAWTRSTRVGSVLLTDDQGAQKTHALRARRARNGMLLLTSTSSADLRGRMRGGAQPSLALTRLPKGTAAATFTTVGEGRGLLRLAAACEGGQRRSSSTVILRFSDGDSRSTSRRSVRTCG